MRVGVDYTAAVRQGAGIGRYARELIRAVVATRTHDFAILAATAGREAQWRAECAVLQDLRGQASGLTVHGIPVTDEWLSRVWQRFRLRLLPEWAMGKLDLFFSPDFVLPPLKQRTPALLTVHDLSYLRHPETFPTPLRRYLERAVPHSIQRADHILADSHATRADLIELLGVPGGKVSTLHLGVSRDFSPAATAGEREVLRSRYGVGQRPYILAVGTVQPRKNYLRLMEACDALAASRPLDLIICGRPAWMASPILEAAAVRPYVRLLGFTDDGDLPALYRQAALLAFPSLYEGFGLPTLEAMACGTPVIASTASSIPEAVGDAGVLLNPLDTELWTRMMGQLLDDPELRAHLTSAGLARAQSFSWETTAQNWLQIAESVAA